MVRKRKAEGVLKHKDGTEMAREEGTADREQH